MIHFKDFIVEALPDAGQRESVRNYIAGGLRGDPLRRAQYWYGRGVGKTTLAEIVAALFHAPAHVDDLAELGKPYGLTPLYCADIAIAEFRGGRLEDRKLLQLLNCLGNYSIARAGENPVSQPAGIPWLLVATGAPVGFFSAHMRPSLDFIEFRHLPAKRDPWLARRIIADELPAVCEWFLYGEVA